MIEKLKQNYPHLNIVSTYQKDNAIKYAYSFKVGKHSYYGSITGTGPKAVNDFKEMVESVENKLTEINEQLDLFIKAKPEAV